MHFGFLQKMVISYSDAQFLECCTYSLNADAIYITCSPSLLSIPRKSDLFGVLDLLFKCAEYSIKSFGKLTISGSLPEITLNTHSFFWIRFLSIESFDLVGQEFPGAFTPSKEGMTSCNVTLPPPRRPACGAEPER